MFLPFALEMEGLSCRLRKIGWYDPRSSPTISLLKVFSTVPRDYFFREYLNSAFCLRRIKLQFSDVFVANFNGTRTILFYRSKTFVRILNLILIIPFIPAYIYKIVYTFNSPPLPLHFFLPAMLFIKRLDMVDAIFREYRDSQSRVEKLGLTVLLSS